MLSSFIPNWTSDSNMCYSACVVLPLWQNIISADDGIVFAEIIYLVCGATSPPSCVLYLLLICVFLGLEPRLVDLGHVDPWALQRCHPRPRPGRRHPGQLLGKRLTKSESELFCICLSIDIVYSFRRIVKLSNRTIFYSCLVPVKHNLFLN